MSGSGLFQWPCGRLNLLCGILLLALAPLLVAGILSNCSHPLVPEHGSFRCDPSPCQGFHHRTSIHFFCEPGYHINSKARLTRCHRGSWVPRIPTCVPIRDSNKRSPDDRLSDSIPNMATTAVGVSIFLLTTTACLVVKSRLYPCQSHSRRSSDQLDLMVEGVPVSLPSYEEAVYGSLGQRLPPRWGIPGPTRLLLAQQEAPPHAGCPASSLGGQSDGSTRPLLSGCLPCPDTPPPPYQEGPRDQRRVAPSDDKDT